jgi:GDPmannose 4,6-dehydratase
MWMIVQNERPDDFVLATGETHSVREFVELAFAEIGKTVCWKGKGVNEIGYDVASGKELVRVDPRYFRPTEVDLLLGDAGKAHAQLGWRHQVTFPELVKEMVAEDLKLLERESWRNTLAE